MEKTLMWSKNFMDEFGERYTLFYWLTSKEIIDFKDNAVIAYGVEIEKFKEDIRLEVECVDFISLKKDVVRNFINSLAQGTATPITLLCLVDDFMSDEEAFVVGKVKSVVY